MMANPLWWGNMAAGSRQHGRIGKLGEHISNSKEEGEKVKRKYREAVNSQSPPQELTSSSKATPPQPYQTVPFWGPSSRILEPMGDILIPAP